MTESLSHPIFRIQNLLIGQATDHQGLTGITVLRFDQGATCAVDVRGAAPGTRETDLLKPENLVDHVHAVVLGGGSTFGLAAMCGVTDYLEHAGVGFPTESGNIPIVTGAILYDLLLGDSKARPTATMGESAAKAANREQLQEGNIGAGTGASVGKVMGMSQAVKSGLGVYCCTQGDLVVAAVIAVNAWGDVMRDGQVIAGTRQPEGKGFINSTDAIIAGQALTGFTGQNTTIGCIVTNATLSKAQALKIAQMGQDGYARAINPVHTLYDGDTLFAAATGEITHSDTNLIGVMAAHAVEQAILRAVFSAEPAGGLPASTQ